MGYSLATVRRPRPSARRARVCSACVSGTRLHRAAHAVLGRRDVGRALRPRRCRPRPRRPRPAKPGVGAASSHGDLPVALPGMTRTVGRRHDGLRSARGRGRRRGAWSSVALAARLAARAAAPGERDRQHTGADGDLRRCRLETSCAPPGASAAGHRRTGRARPRAGRIERCRRARRAAGPARPVSGEQHPPRPGGNLGFVRAEPRRAAAATGAGRPRSRGRRALRRSRRATTAGRDRRRRRTTCTAPTTIAAHMPRSRTMRSFTASDRTFPRAI